MTGQNIYELEVGETAEFSKTVSESDVYLFAGITADFNPAHIDESHAQKTFLNPHCPRNVECGLYSAVLGNKLPGPGTIYLRQELVFKAPVYVGDTITAQVKVLELNHEKNRARLKTICTNQEGKIVLEGEALVSPPKLPTEKS